MSTWIKAGFWESLCKNCKGYKGWLNLDNWFSQKRGYKAYIVNFGATSTDDLTPKYVLENTIGNITITTVTAGTYRLTLPETVDASKIYIANAGDGWYGWASIPVLDSSTGVTNGSVSFYAGDLSVPSNIIEIYCRDLAGVAVSYRTLFGDLVTDPTQNGTGGLFFELRIYN